ncbi:MAG: class B sortase [Lachnospiraceae bacterium]|nr:class B sortase [Lachnospiraceae bacterium]
MSKGVSAGQKPLWLWQKECGRMEEKLSRREKRKQFRMKRNRICLAMLAMVSLAVFIYSAYSLWDYYADHRREEGLKKELASLRNVGEEDVAVKAGADVEGTKVSESLQTKRTAEDIAAFYEEMKHKNEDYVCWITVDGSSIDYPVVKKDNSFYLNHDFYGEISRHGSIFMDETCGPEDEVLLVHGHHMKDGTMFGDLKRYKDDEFRKKHRTILLEFADGISVYRVFALAKIDLTDENSFRFEVLPKTAEEKVLYIEGLDDAAFWYDETQADAESGVLVLSTCDYGTDEERLIVAAKKIE